MTGWIPTLLHGAYNSGPGSWQFHKWILPVTENLERFWLENRETTGLRSLVLMLFSVTWQMDAEEPNIKKNQVRPVGSELGFNFPRLSRSKSASAGCRIQRSYRSPDRTSGAAWGGSCSSTMQRSHVWRVSFVFDRSSVPLRLGVERIDLRRDPDSFGNNRFLSSANASSKTDLSTDIEGSFK